MPLPSRVSTSRAYWNLRAEQVMDKVFEQDAFDAGERHLVPVDVAVEEPTPTPAEMATPAASTKAQDSTLWLLPMLTGIAVASVVSCGWLIGNWQISQSQLEQERNLLIVERLRQNITPTAVPAPAPAQPQQPSHVQQPSQTQQPQLSDLPPPTTQQPISLAPLTLPIRQTPLSTQQPQSPSISPTPDAGLPQELPLLTGVVQGPGGNSSAIFQVGQSSLSAGIGESIGNSGWTLDAINDTGAVIKRNGERRNLSVGGVF